MKTVEVKQFRDDSGNIVQLQEINGKLFLLPMYPNGSIRLDKGGCEELAWELIAYAGGIVIDKQNYRRQIMLVEAITAGVVEIDADSHKMFMDIGGIVETFGKLVFHSETGLVLDDQIWIKIEMELQRWKTSTFPRKRTGDLGSQK